MPRRPNPATLLTSACRLSTGDLESLIAALQSELETRSPGEAEVWHEEWRTCSTPGCRCQQGHKHGPYRFKSIRVDGRVKKIYQGRLAKEQG